MAEERSHKTTANRIAQKYGSNTITERELILGPRVQPSRWKPPTQLLKPPHNSVVIVGRCILPGPARKR